MRHMTLMVFALIVAPSVAGAATSVAPPIHPGIWPIAHSPIGKDPAIEAKIDDLLAHMSIRITSGPNASILATSPARSKKTAASPRPASRSPSSITAARAILSSMIAMRIACPYIATQHSQAIVYVKANRRPALAIRWAQGIGFKRDNAHSSILMVTPTRIELVFQP